MRERGVDGERNHCAGARERCRRAEGENCLKEDMDRVRIVRWGTPKGGGGYCIGRIEVGTWRRREGGT